MTDEERAAYIMSAVVATNIEFESMKAANRDREVRQQSDAYGEDAFMQLKERHEAKVAEISSI